MPLVQDACIYDECVDDVQEDFFFIPFIAGFDVKWKPGEVRKNYYSGTVAKTTEEVAKRYPGNGIIYKTKKIGDDKIRIIERVR